ncbi:hypothetical protein B0H19DRAFT_1080032 [Mycena capillaripes]|nr:hypothetical protein B0H19DRAFT_1080032 [Mycena capillaripes]
MPCPVAPTVCALYGSAPEIETVPRLRDQQLCDILRRANPGAPLPRLHSRWPVLYVRGALSPLPPLSTLRLLDLVIRAINSTAAWLIGNLPRLLSSAPPSLQEISVTCTTLIRPPLQQSYPKPEALEAIDTLITRVPSSPRLKWRLDFERNTPEQAFAEFVSFVMRGMPRIYEMDKVSVQRHSFRDDMREWPIR